MNLLQNGDLFCGYTVQYLIKTGAFAETYRIANTQGRSFFLKLLRTSLLPPGQLTPQGEPREIAICRQIDHPGFITFRDAGQIQFDEQRHDYLITDYLQGELVAERLQREERLASQTAIQIALQVLEGLHYLHTSPQCLIHNDITARNIMFDTAEDGQLSPHIIDMGHTSVPCSGCVPFTTDDLEAHYRAPETFLGIYTPATDIFSVGTLLFRMLFGLLPWQCDLEGCTPAQIKARLKEARNTPLVIPEQGAEGPVNTKLAEALQKSLAPARSQRYGTAREFLDALSAVLSPSFEAPNTLFSSKTTSNQPSKPNSNLQLPSEPSHTAVFRKIQGNGFADVAGMAEIKEHLRIKVINILRDKQRAARYKLTIPNGMLLYGPPGCGKTFLANKFAEETGFNYTQVNSSDLASTYIHGSQQMIGSLFRQARASAPTVLCFDEFDALAPNRKGMNHSGQSGEVNEFLSQLNNCGKDNVFVIATSNRPEMIDPAILRTGRIDRMVFVPAPDAEARKALFAINLKDRPCEQIDTQELAGLTENFVASDIAYVVNDAATTAAFTDRPISQQILKETIRCMRPSISREMLLEYDALRERIERGSVQNRPRIGYRN